MEHRAFLYGALVDAPQGVSRPPVRREISQWGRGPFGGTIEDNHLIFFPLSLLFEYNALPLHYLKLLVSAKHFLPRLSPVYESVFRQRLVWTGLTRSLEETAEHRRGRKPPVLMRCETKGFFGV